MPGKSSKTAKLPAIWIGVRPGELVGHQPCSITLWLLVESDQLHHAVASSRRNHRYWRGILSNSSSGESCGVFVFAEPDASLAAGLKPRDVSRGLRISLPKVSSNPE